MDKQIITAISARLASLNILEWIDIEFGQLSQQNPPVAFPCALLEISYPRCEDITDESQFINAQIILRVAQLSRGETEYLTRPEDSTIDPLSYIDNIQSIHLALQGWNADGMFSPLSRASCTPERRTDAIKVYRMVYNTTFGES